MPRLHHAALYHRVSTVDQNRHAARAELRAAARRLGLRVVLDVRETGSGANNQRPGLIRVLQAAQRGEIDTVLVWKLDHFGRSAFDLLGNIRQLEAAGVRFMAVTQGIDIRPSGDPMPRLLLTMLSAVAEFERGPGGGTHPPRPGECPTCWPASRPPARILAASGDGQAAQGRRRHLGRDRRPNDGDHTDWAIPRLYCGNSEEPVTKVLTLFSFEGTTDEERLAGWHPVNVIADGSGTVTPSQAFVTDGEYGLEIIPPNSGNWFGASFDPPVDLTGYMVLKYDIQGVDVGSVAEIAVQAGPDWTWCQGGMWSWVSAGTNRIDNVRAELSGE